MKVKSFSVLLLVVTFLTGLAMYFPCRAFLYEPFAYRWPLPVLMGLLFFLLALTVSAAALLCGLLRENLKEHQLPIAAGVLAGIFVAGALFQFLYNLHGGGGAVRITTLTPASYIFVIDDSGSMKDNDPRGERFQAVRDEMNGYDSASSYAVYRFAGDVERVREMSPASEGADAFDGNSTGETAIYKALSKVMSDNPMSGTGGLTPKVLLFTDGIQTDFSQPDIQDANSDIMKLLNQYKAQGISVYTVTLGDINEDVMETIANVTGGKRMTIREISGLREAVREVIQTSGTVSAPDRDLVTARYNDGIGWALLFGFLRVLFLSVLGGLIALAAALAFGESDDLPAAVALSTACAAGGALILELWTDFGGSDRFGWPILWLGLAVTLAWEAKTPKAKKPPKPPKKPPVPPPIKPPTPQYGKR